MSRPTATPPPALAVANALRGFEAVLGSAHVQADDAAQTHADPYSFSEADAFRPGGVVRPGSVDDLQAVLRVAHEHGVPLWTVSTGRNLGYGGAAPRVASSVVVDLQRMNRVLEVDEALGYAVVEPGVRFLDLYEHLQAHGHRLVMSVPDIGWGSVIGNALERGFGYAAHWDHAAQVCGMEVVLADGTVVRTGMGAKTGSPAAHVYKGGFGPSIDGLFFQSNLGIVTKVGVWLMPRPEVMAACTLKARHDGDLGPLVDTLRPLLQDGTVQSNVTLGNATVIASMISQRRAWYEGAGPMPAAAVQAMREGLGLGAWNGRFGLYGAAGLVEARVAVARRALERIPGVELTVRTYPGDVKAAQAHPADMAVLGIPTTALVRMGAWRTGGEPAHTDFSLVCPATGAHAVRQHRMVSTLVEAGGIDYAGGFTLGPRHAIALALMSYDRHDAAHREQVRSLKQRLIEAADAAGDAPYRSHVAFMDLTAAQYGFNDHALGRVVQSLKQALDPAGLLSPGKQGIWPAGPAPTA